MRGSGSSNSRGRGARLLAAGAAAAAALAAAAGFLVLVRNRRRRSAAPGAGASEQTSNSTAAAPQQASSPKLPPLDATPSKAFFFNHQTWGTSAPRRVRTGTSAADAVPRPTTAQGWLELGWSLNTGAVAWVAAPSSSSSAAPQAITEREAYVAGLTLDRGVAQLWLLLGVELMTAEEALNDERRRELDDDAAPDLVWTVTVPGIGSRLYADACLRRAVELSDKADAAVSWAALGRYADITHTIVTVGGEPRTAEDCFRAAIKPQTHFGVVGPQFAYFCLRNDLAFLPIDGDDVCSRYNGLAAAAQGGVNDAVIWSALADLLMQESQRACPAGLPLTTHLYQQDFAAVDCALQALRLNESSIAAWRSLVASIDTKVMGHVTDFGSRTMPNGAPLSRLEALTQAVDRFPFDAKLNAALAALVGPEHPTYRTLLTRTWQFATTAERPLLFYDIAPDPPSFTHTPHEKGSSPVSVMAMFGQAVHEEPNNAAVWLGYARAANMAYNNDPSRMPMFDCWPTAPASEPTEGDLDSILLDAVASSSTKGTDTAAGTTDAAEAKPLSREADLSDILADAAAEFSEATPVAAQSATVDVVIKQRHLDDITARALWLNPSDPRAWYDCLSWSRRPDQLARINGIDVDPVTAYAALVDRNLNDASVWFLLANALIESGQSHVVLRDTTLSALDCARHAAVRDQSHVSAWRTIATLCPTEHIPLEAPLEGVTRLIAFRHAVQLSNGSDAMVWAALGNYLKQLPAAQQTVEVCGVTVDPRQCWLYSIQRSHPHRRPRSLAISLKGLADLLDNDDDRISLEMRPPQDDAPPVVREMNRVEMLAFAADTTHTGGCPSDQWRNRNHTAGALRALAAILGPDETVEVLGAAHTKDELYQLAHDITAWTHDQQTLAVEPEP